MGIPHVKPTVGLALEHILHEIIQLVLGGGLREVYLSVFSNVEVVRHAERLSLIVISQHLNLSGIEIESTGTSRQVDEIQPLSTQLTPNWETLNLSNNFNTPGGYSQQRAVFEAGVDRALVIDLNVFGELQTWVLIGVDVRHKLLVEE